MIDLDKPLRHRAFKNVVYTVAFRDETGALLDESRARLWFSNEDLCKHIENFEPAPPAPRRVWIHSREHGSAWIVNDTCICAECVQYIALPDIAPDIRAVVTGWRGHSSNAMDAAVAALAALLPEGER